MIDFRVLVVDDELLAREMVAGLVKRDGEVTSVIECGDARRVPDLISEHHPHIVFLDVEMPGLDGIQLARTFSAEDPVVVFITAFSQYATQAFDVRATDYVLKPFSDARLFEALTRAKRRVREHRLGGLANEMATLTAELHPQETVPAKPETGTRFLEQISFQAGDRSIELKVGDVIWIKAEDYYVLIHSKRGRQLVRTTLSALEQRLDPLTFLRVHRAAIVNVHEVQEIRDENGLSLVLSDGSDVPVSRSRRAHLEAILRSRLR